jgi:hypothetical protein
MQQAHRCPGAPPSSSTAPPTPDVTVAAQLDALHAAARTLGEAKYVDEKGPLEDFSAALPGDETARRRRKLESAYLSRYRRAAYTRLLKIAVGEAGVAKARLVGQRARLVKENARLRMEIVGRENQRLREELAAGEMEDGDWWRWVAPVDCRDHVRQQDQGQDAVQSQVQVHDWAHDHDHMSQGLTEDVTEGMSEDMSEDITEDVNDVMAEDMTDDMIDDMTESPTKSQSVDRSGDLDADRYRDASRSPCFDPVAEEVFAQLAGIRRGAAATIEDELLKKLSDDGYEHGWLSRSECYFEGVLLSRPA